MFIRILKFYYKLIGKTPDKMPMVKYWKHKESCSAIITRSKDGSIVMQMDGEDYPFPTFPRGHLLFGYLSKLKHEIKNQIFNASWALLEKGENKQLIIKMIKNKLFGEISEIAFKMKHDMLPPEKMCPSVREIHRAWTKVSPETGVLRDYLCFILQEDDAYRFRVQWMSEYFGLFPKLKPVNSFRKALEVMEHGEVIGDMKERIRLLRRILLLALEDESIKTKFEKLFKEINWSKVKLTEGDKYHFRGKYFKVDYNLFEY